jgi:hypothetical protein
VLYSLSDYHGNGDFNRNACGWHLYQGEITTDAINMVSTNSAAIGVLELTGTQIKELVEGGFQYDDSEPYEYRLITKGDMELEDDRTYRLAVGSDEIAEEWDSAIQLTEMTPGDALTAYITKLGTFNADDVNWE